MKSNRSYANNGDYVSKVVVSKEVRVVKKVNKDMIKGVSPEMFGDTEKTKAKVKLRKSYGRLRKS